jgi:hypothetical protein
VTLVLRAPSPAAALSPADAGCRTALAGAALRPATTALKEQQRCREIRMSSADLVSYPAGLDCNGRFPLHAVLGRDVHAVTHVAHWQQ